MSIWWYQPFKTLYILYTACVVVFLQLPIWFITAIPRSWRPRRSWSIQRVIIVKLLRRVYGVVRKVGQISKYPTYKEIVPGPDSVWVAPVPQLITGDLDVWAKAANISPIRVPGYWLHKDGSSIAFGAPPMPGEKLVYAMHGGGYCERSAHPSDPTAEIARSLLQHCESVHRVFSIEYRLSTIPPDPPANPFPAALFDAIAGYNYLVKTIGFSPDNIVFVGDSAGGNLAHALTRYIVEHYGIPGLGLPAVPGALILLSPWVDIGQSHIVPGAVVIDHLDNEQAIFYANAFLGPHGKPAADLNRYVSPASLHPLMQVSFKGFPRTFIAVGGAELFLDQIETLKDRMVRDLGVGNGVNSKEGTGKVTYFEVPDGVHDYIPFTWHEPERTQTLIEIGKWMSSL